MQHVVRFHRPIIGDGSIRFSWESSALDTLFRDQLNYVEFEYHNSVELNLETSYHQLMCLFFPLLHGGIGGDVHVIFEDPLDAEAVAHWIQLRGSTSVTVGSKTFQGKSPTHVSGPAKGVALLYGGGKDSLGALSVFSNAWPDRELSLLRVHWSKQSVERHRSIFNTEVIARLRKSFDFNYLECSSTFHRNLVDRKSAHHVGLSFYHACMLPYYRTYHFEAVNYSYDALEFHTTPSQGYVSLRPEAARQTSMILDALGMKTKIRNISFGIPSFLHFDIVKLTNAKNLAMMYMCEDTRSRWCYNCRKCFTFALLGLEAGMKEEDLEFAYSSLLGPSGYITTNILPLLEKSHGEYSPKLAYKAQFSSFQHVLSHLDPSELKSLGIVDEEFIDVITKLRALYASIHPLTRQIWSKAVRFEGQEDADTLLRFFENLGLPSCDLQSVKMRTNRETTFQIPEEYHKEPL